MGILQWASVWTADLFVLWVNNGRILPIYQFYPLFSIILQQNPEPAAKLMSVQ